ncbi:CYTOCHROME C OXIDASE 19-2 [Salix viminalis]|uniref:CYTOCHROME C OXIDASE 19-2 n=1 Tax=Salix viminalis TaxID=40686 RepID=A0A9Q0YZ74_SALVM|nr:CYTOCHROME C OXIDASE 19-2 [Salix viminalis]
MKRGCSFSSGRKAAVVKLLSLKVVHLVEIEDWDQYHQKKGIFPLDHMHECDLEKKDFLDCLKSSGHQSEKSSLFSKKYLEWRMEKNLMAKQEMSELGFGNGCFRVSFFSKNSISLGFVFARYTSRSLQQAFPRQSSPLNWQEGVQNLHKENIKFQTGIVD